MAFCYNETELLSNGESYYFSPKHRGSGNPKASKWLKDISYQIEHKLADLAIKEYFEQKKPSVAFNFYRKNNAICPLGYNNLHKALIIAKFVNSSTELWHGYPGDYISNNQDKPTEITLKNFVSHGILSKKEMRCISKGQRL